MNLIWPRSNICWLSVNMVLLSLLSRPARLSASLDVWAYLAMREVSSGNKVLTVPW